MIYFAKSNYFLNNHKLYFKVLEKAHATLVSYQKSVKDVNQVLPVNNPKLDLVYTEHTAITLIKNGLLDDGYSEYEKIAKAFKIKFVEGNDLASQLEPYILTLKIFQSFEGKINFQPLIDIFNYEQEVYFDKLFRFSLLPNLDKKLIPEFMSSVFALLFFNKSVHNNIRRPLEQYLISLMANMNYQYFSSASQLQELVSTYFSEDKNILFVVGACPENFIGPEDGETKEIKDFEYFKILKERLEAANTIIKATKKCSMPKSGLYIRKKGFVEIEHNLKSQYPKDTPWICLDKMLDAKKNITKENIAEIMNNYYFGFRNSEDEKIKPQKCDNLIIVTSTFHIYKVALEVERWFFKENILIEYRPKNVVIIGNETFYELMSHKDDAINKVNQKNKVFENENQAELELELQQIQMLRKKKIKNFMFEIFQHALDKNSIK
jgi:hypothetical protein